MSILLSALDGSNPLAFLTAIGSLRLLDIADNRVRLRWLRQGVWRPEFLGIESQDLAAELHGLASAQLPIRDFSSLGKNLTVAPRIFQHFVSTAFKTAKQGDRKSADFAGAFGSEICEKEGKERIEYTDFCFITGSGHQDFIGTIAGLVECVTRQHIHDALFGSWKKERKFSLRWDPADAAEYAFRWGDPSADGASAVWGANLLAVHALPLLPCQPTDEGLQTTGFRKDRPWDEFTWPMWRDPISADSVRSVLGMSELTASEGDLQHAALRARGIQEVFRSARVRIGQGANFKVSFRPAKAV